MCPIPFGCGKCHPAQFDGECGICGYPIKKADPVEGIAACVISKCYELGHVHTDCLKKALGENKEIQEKPPEERLTRARLPQPTRVDRRALHRQHVAGE